jgi:hypothetical protein
MTEAAKSMQQQIDDLRAIVSSVAGEVEQKISKSLASLRAEVGLMVRDAEDRIRGASLENSQPYDGMFRIDVSEDRSQVWCNEGLILAGRYGEYVFPTADDVSSGRYAVSAAGNDDGEYYVNIALAVHPRTAKFTAFYEPYILLQKKQTSPELHSWPDRGMEEPLGLECEIYLPLAEVTIADGKFTRVWQIRRNPIEVQVKTWLISGWTQTPNVPDMQYYIDMQSTWNPRHSVMVAHGDPYTGDDPTAMRVVIDSTCPYAANLVFGTLAIRKTPAFKWHEDPLSSVFPQTESAELS